ncbi:MAG: multicopper oxidase family protein [Hyphomicrobiaceae bacterium]|nr:multicopper oxidase family protein [Hyphomicrobiaceae bacterium]
MTLDVRSGAFLTRRSIMVAAAALGGAALLPRGLKARAAGDPVSLEAKPGEARFLPQGPATPVWGYGGSVPGPEIRVRQGADVLARLTNGIGEPTTIHWHGIRIDNAMDGVAHLTQHPVMPGQSFDYRFKAPDAGTFWYHPHAHQVMQQDRGLYGLLIVEEPEPAAVDREVSLVIDDWRLDADGAIETRSLEHLFDAAHAGRIGNLLTVNGRVAPELPARAGERLRVRLCNACNARVLELTFEEARAQVVAVDGQPIAPEPLPGDGTLVVPPSGRADLVLDMAGGPGSRAAVKEVSRQPVSLAHFALAEGERARDKLLDAPVSLPRNPVRAPDLGQDPLVFALLMEGGAMSRMAGARFKGEYHSLRELAQKHRMVWAFNGKANNHSEPMLTVAAGRPVVIEMVNDTAWPHAMHIHGHHMLVTARTRGAVKPWFRDTVLMEAREEMTVAFLADNPGKWMLHCHMLEHQMAGMSAYFEVTRS